MTDENRRYQKPRITSTSQPRNTEGLEFLEIGLEDIELYSIGVAPVPDGKGKPTQVHISITVAGLDLPLVVRFKGPGALDALISALAVHRFHVWPDQDYTEEEFA